MDTVPAAGAYGDGATFGNGLCTIDEKVHENLVELGGNALDGRDIAILLNHLRLVFNLVPDNVKGALYTLMKIGTLPVGLIDPRKILQISDNLFYPAQALFTLRDDL